MIPINMIMRERPIIDGSVVRVGLLGMNIVMRVDTAEKRIRMPEE